jgi:hypothetical protein
MKKHSLFLYNNELVFFTDVLLFWIQTAVIIYEPTNSVYILHIYFQKSCNILYCMIT